MRFGVRRGRRSGGVSLNMSSMIDCTFLLLAYFVFTTTISRPENRLTPALRVERRVEAGASRDWQPQVIEVRRTEEGPVYLLGTQVFREKGALVDALRGLRADSGLFVRVGDGVPVGFAAAALQAGRDAGFELVTYVPAE